MPDANPIKRAADHQALIESQRVKDRDKDRQRTLAASVLGKRVHDIVDFRGW